MTSPVAYSHPVLDGWYNRQPPSPQMPSFARPPGPPALSPHPPSYSGSDSSGSTIPAYELRPSPPLDSIEPASSLPPGLAPAFSALNVQERRDVKRGVLASLRGKGPSNAADKDAIEIVLTEALVFVTPPRTGLASQGVEGDGTGKEARINGFVHILSIQAKMVDGVSVKLEAFHQLPGDGQSVRPSKREVFLSRELFVCASADAGQQIWLEQGVNTFEFAFTLPASAATSERSPTGNCQYHVSANVVGSASKLRPALQTSREVIVVCNPHRESNVLQYQHHHEGLSQHFGPHSLDITSNEMILAAPLGVTLTLASPPPALTIFAVHAFMIQVTTVLPCDRPPSQIVGARRYIVREGERGASGVPGWAARARAGKGAPGGNGIILDNRREGASKGEYWRWTKVGRLPNDSTLRPSTLEGTVTPLRFSSSLVVEVVFSEESADPKHDGKVKIATLFDREVHISSCCCWLPYLALPTYSADTPEQAKFKWHIEGCIGCMCDENWESLERTELELMRGGASDEIPGDGVATRRPLPATKPSHVHANGSSCAR